MAKAQLNVAIAILLQHGKVLVGFRQAHQHQGNKYEFPGGKVEEGESPVAACRREVLEEVGIELHDWLTFDFIQHEYDDLIVNLHIFQAVVPVEFNQKIQTPWTWYTRPALAELNFPKANQRLIQRLNLKAQINVSTALTDLAECAAQQCLYWQSDLSLEIQMKMLAEISVEKMSHLVVSPELYQVLNSIQQTNIAAIYLKAGQLLQLQKGDLLLGKSYIAHCHDELSLAHAQSIGCDVVLLESTQRSWQAFTQLAAKMHIPVFAWTDDVEHAKQHAAYGIVKVIQE